MSSLDTLNVSLVRKKDILVYLERKLGRTSVLVKRLEKDMLNLKEKGGQPPNSVSVDNNNYVLWKSAEIPVFSMREGTHIYPPLPDLGSTEPIEDLIGDLDIYENRAPKLRLPNGVRLSYNDIIALAGTFYGIEGSISDPGDETHFAKFERAYNDLALRDPDTVQSELDQLLAIMAIERNSVETVLGHGDPSIPTVLDETMEYAEPSTVYKRHGLWFTQQYDMILGGGGVKGKRGKVLNLAKNNMDHYQPHCLEVWRIGHELALEKARQAGALYDTQVEQGFAMLEEAYSISAFSCNYLVQSFTAGHIRVPVKQLNSDVSGFNGYKLGYYNFAEDEKYGINVTNKLNERWTCFGQKKFYDQFNQSHREKVVKALQDVVAQIFSAFGDPNYRGDYGAILNQVPEPDTRMPNNFPLFRVSTDGKLLKRYNVGDLSSPTTTSGWWGGTTVDKVKYNIPTNSQVRLPGV